MQNELKLHSRTIEINKGGVCVEWGAGGQVKETMDIKMVPENLQCQKENKML